MNPLPIAPHLIPLIFHWVVTIFCVVLCVQYSSSNNCDNLLKQKSPFWMVVFSILLMIFMGMRPVWGGFGDTQVYAHTYNMTNPEFSAIDWHSEWLFSFFRIWCRTMGFNVTMFFFLIEIGYIGLMLWAFWRVLWEDVWFAMLFAFSAFSFFTYGVNGMRNGLACSMCLVAFAEISKNKNFVLGAIFCIAALGVHRSTMLPISAFIAAMFLVKNVKWAILFWIISIVVSLFAGMVVTNFFAGLGFDDRMANYMSTSYADKYDAAHTGEFRWDFLIYSAVPVILTWYAVIKKDIKDKTFHVLATTYILSNAFWVMVCRGAFSNRFAYLSWFMYPLVIAYAVIRLPIWEDQDRRAGWILLGHAAFTQFMFLIGKI